MKGLFMGSGPFRAIAALLAAAMILGAAAPAAAKTRGPGRKARSYFRSAVGHCQRANFDKSMARFRKAFGLYPGGPPPRPLGRSAAGPWGTGAAP